MEIKPKDHIVIIGGGFAGMRLVKDLKNAPVRITLIDKQNYHSFQPLFYQVASARLEPASISFPFRKVFQKFRNFEFRMAEVKSVDTGNNLLITSNGVVHYDHLIIGTGCTTNFFGNEEIKNNSLAMKTMQEAIEIRNRILLGFEDYQTADFEKKEALMNLIIVGAGATGVELAGSFAELRNDILPKDYPKVDFSKLRIILLEGSPFTLGVMSDQSKKMSRKYLEDLGVEIKTGVVLQSYDGNTAKLSSGEIILCSTLIWSAGVTGNVIPGVTTSENLVRNRYVVDRNNLVKGTKNVYAVGDIAYMETPLFPKGHPQVANVAITQARNLAKNIKKTLGGKMINEYEYRDKGSMATIGKNKAVVDLKFWKFQGLFAWFVWMFLHLMLILSVRNKLIIFINWAWSYVTKDTSLRLIINPDEKNKP